MGVTQTAQQAGVAPTVRATMNLPAEGTPTATAWVLPTSTPGVSSTDQADLIQEIANWGKGEITQAAYSPDGKRLGVVATLGVYLYDAKSLKQLDFIPNATLWPPAAFAPDWSVLALGNGTTVRLLRLADHSEEAHFETQPGHVTSLLFSPDGKYLACLVQPPGEEVYTWNMELRRAADGQLLATWEAGAMPEVAFSSDSQTFYAWNPFRMAEMRRWQIPSGQPQEFIQNPALDNIAFSPDGRWTAETDSASAQTILLKKTGQEQPVFRLPWANSGHPLLRFTPDSYLLIVSASGNSFQIWRTADGALLRTIQAGNADSQFLTISPDSQTFVLNAWDGLDFYQLEDGRVVKHQAGHYQPLRQVALSPQDNAAAAVIPDQGDQTGLVVWRVPDGQVMQHISPLAAIALAWSPDGTDIALGEWGGRIQILRAADGQEVLSWSTQTEQVQSIAYSPDGKLLVSSSMSSVNIWQVRDGALMKRLFLPGGWASSLRFSRNGDRLAVVSGDGSVRVWQAPVQLDGDWKELGRFPTSDYGNDSLIDFTPDGQSLVIGEPSVNHPPSQVWLWRVGDQKSTQHIPLPQAKLNTLRLSPDGLLLACGLTDGTIWLLQIPEGNILRSLESGADFVASLDFSADGRTLIAASGDGTIHVWKMR